MTEPKEKVGDKHLARILKDEYQKLGLKYIKFSL
jgi:hypothetical protein